MTTSLRILPVDYEDPDDPESGMKSLIRRMERTGKLKTVQPFLMTRARTLFVRKHMTKRAVAKAVGVELMAVERWIMSYGWEELKAENEFRHYQKVAGIRRRSVPNIDEKHDQMFHNLESLLEDTIYRIKKSEKGVEPKDLATLATAARICMDCRRTVHKKEGVVSRQIIELKDNTVFNEVASMLLDTVAQPQLTEGQPEVLKTIPFTIEDQDLESEKDIV